MNTAVVVPETPPVEPEKSADKTVAQVNEVVTYTIKVTNHDDETKTNVLVKDTNNFAGEIVATNGDGYIYNGDHTWTIAELGAGETINIVYTCDGVSFHIRVVDVGVYAQTISAAIADNHVYGQMLQSNRSYIIDIGGGTTNVIAIIDRRPQNPGITLEEMGVFELFKLAHRSVMEDCGRNVDDFMLDVLMQGKQSCTASMADALERAKNEFVKRLILELESRKVDLDMGFICMVGGGSILLYDAFQRYVTMRGNQNIVIIPDVKANAKGYYAQEMARLAAAGVEVYRGTAKA